MARISLFTVVVLASVSCFSSELPSGERNTISPSTQSQQSAVKISGMPVYIEPFYNSKGLRIKVGKHSKELAKATAESIPRLATKMKSEWSTLPIEAMYVMSIRLYDLGLKDEAVYWFYSAQYRTRLLNCILPEGSGDGILPQAYGAFYMLVGEYVNGYAFGDMPKLQKTIQMVLSDNRTLPDFSEIYPRLKFIDKKSWPEKNRHIAKGLKELSAQITKKADEIRATRKANGVEGKY